MNVLHLTARADIGGGQESMLRLINHTSAAVVNYAGCPCEEPYWARFERAVRRDRMCEIPHRKFSPSALRRLVTFSRDHEISLIHSHGFGAGLYSRPVSSATGIPVIHTFHGLIFKAHNPLWTFPRLVTEWGLCRTTGTLVAVSDSERTHLRKWLFPFRNKILTVHNGIKMERSEHNENEQVGGKTRIVWVGRFHEQKNPLQLVEIVEHLIRLRPRRDYVVDIVGDGPLNEEFRGAVERRGLGELILFHGSQQSVTPYYRRARVLLSTSLWEGLPNAILEAFANGLLVIATDVVGNVDLVAHKQTGLLFPKNRPDLAAKLLSEVLDGSIIDDPMRFSCQEMARQRFTMEACSSNYLRLYRRAVEHEAARAF